MTTRWVTATRISGYASTPSSLVARDNSFRVLPCSSVAVSFVAVFFRVFPCSSVAVFPWRCSSVFFRGGFSVAVSSVAVFFCVFPWPCMRGPTTWQWLSQRHRQLFESGERRFHGPHALIGAVPLHQDGALVAAIGDHA